MDPIKILVGIGIIVASAANISGAKAGLKSAVSTAISRPKSYLQKTPPNISALILVMLILGVFGIGTIEIADVQDYLPVRMIGFAVFVFFSWLQVKAYKSLGKNYTQDISVKNGQEIVSTGIYKYVRHPQYLGQVMGDIGAAVALLSSIALPIILLVELPLFILRAREEEKLLIKYYPEEYTGYKKATGFFIPFIG